MEITDFLLNCTDVEYQRWWPGTHLSFHTTKRVAGDVGNRVFMDEYVGRRRVRGHAVVVDAVRGERLVWQFQKLIRLPARLILELKDLGNAVRLTHRLEAGYRGLGSILDPLLRLYLSRRFAEDLDSHVRTEFPMLRDLLRAGR